LWVPQVSNLKAKSLQRQAFHILKLLLVADARFGIEGDFLRNFLFVTKVMTLSLEDVEKICDHP
jgi:hypothetical protein